MVNNLNVLCAFVAISSVFAAPLNSYLYPVKAANSTVASIQSNSTAVTQSTAGNATVSDKGGKNATNTANKKGNGVGAVYFITNDIGGNQLVVNKVDATGKLSFVKAVQTGGKGAVGNGGAPDALFSQDSVKVSGNHVLAVNAGSNTVSIFSINPKDATDVKQLGGAVSTSGEFPVSVASNPTNRARVCVLNGGAKNGVACYHIDNKAGLKAINNSVRSLDLNQTTPATGPAGSVSDLKFTQDGKQLIASVKGSGAADKGFLASWDVSTKDGSLSADFVKIPAAAGALPFGMSRVPGSKDNAFLVTDPAVGATVFNINRATADAKKLAATASKAKKAADAKAAADAKNKANAQKAAEAKAAADTKNNGTAVVAANSTQVKSTIKARANSTSTVIESSGAANSTSSKISTSTTSAKASQSTAASNNGTAAAVNAETTAIPVDGQGAVCWSSRSQKTGSFFLTDILTSIVTEVSLDKNLQGKVVKQYPLTKGSATIDSTMATIKKNDFLYVLSPNGTVAQIDVLAVGAKAGQATKLQTFEIGNDLKKANVNFVGKDMQGLAVFIQ